MKTQKKLIAGYLILIMLMITGTALAQDDYQLKKSKSSIEVSGTSNLHDWEMNVNDFRGSLSLEKQEDDINILRLFFRAKTESIESDKNLMNKKAKEALKAEEHSNITFRFSRIKNINKSANDISGTIEGSLTIAGKTNTINLSFSGEFSNNQLHVEDTYILNMKDYNVEPPKAMMGSIKTDEKVKVDFDVVFSDKDKGISIKN